MVPNAPMRMISPFALALAAAVALAGCPSGPRPGECKTDSDCKDPLRVCVAGFCRQCAADAQCAAGEACVDNACAAKGQCASTKDCKAGEKCAQNTCVPECADATAEQDCGAGRKCIAGRCAAEEECLADADCGAGKACAQQRCVAQGAVLESKDARALGDCEVRAVHFGYDESTLPADGRKTLDDDWQCLQKTKLRRLTLTGHTDERGTTEYNLALGARRAEAVRRYLAGLGAEAALLRTLSYGKERPAASGHDEAAYAKNRRVELIPEAQ